MTLIERGTDQHVRGQVSRMFDRLVDSNSSATTVDWSKARSQYRTFASNAVLAFSDPPNSGIFTLAIFNSSGGSITITLPATSTLASTTVLTSDVNYLFYWYDGEAASVERYILISEENANVVPLVLSVTLPDGVLGEAYSGTLSATGGVSPYTYSVSSGALPDGLTLNASTGAVTGTPTVEDVFSVTVMVTDNIGGTDDSAESITISETTLLVDLISWWDYEETGNETVTRVDSHGPHDFDTNSNLSHNASGLIGQCIQHAVAGGYLSRADSGLSGIDFTTGDFTLACWYNSAATTNNTGLLSRYDTGGNNRMWSLLVEAGQPTFALSDDGTGGGTTILAWGSAPAADTWHLCIAWRSTTDDMIYLQVDNGTPVSASFDSATTVHNATVDLYALALNASLYGSALRADSAAIWGRELTSTERTALWNSGAGLQYSDL